MRLSSMCGWQVVQLPTAARVLNMHFSTSYLIGCGAVPFFPSERYEHCFWECNLSWKTAKKKRIVTNWSEQQLLFKVKNV